MNHCKFIILYLTRRKKPLEPKGLNEEMLFATVEIGTVKGKSALSIVRLLFPRNKSYEACTIVHLNIHLIINP